MRVSIIAVVAVVSAGLVGCGSSDPPQPKMSDTQVKDVMDKAKGQTERESGGRRGGGMGAPVK